ncbi:hypothetical protein [Undibacterium pigrum]|uniref:Uncharacterized protein n=1 Tax=Undibacterium pigrum TaxID=401470 RepID=A0A318JB92_9BURK|nr:hypothetical protein [Undibacterium pigrum]PXX45327.1 hypothetical protein DFR42_102555 [Undibacterium pigrum]
MKKTGITIPETASGSLGVQTTPQTEIRVLKDEEILSVAGGPEVDIEVGGG